MTTEGEAELIVDEFMEEEEGKRKGKITKYAMWKLLNLPALPALAPGQPSSSAAGQHKQSPTMKLTVVKAGAKSPDKTKRENTKN